MFRTKIVSKKNDHAFDKVFAKWYAVLYNAYCAVSGSSVAYPQIRRIDLMLHLEQLAPEISEKDIVEFVNEAHALGDRGLFFSRHEYLNVIFIVGV